MLRVCVCACVFYVLPHTPLNTLYPTHTNTTATPTHHTRCVKAFMHTHTHIRTYTYTYIHIHIHTSLLLSPHSIHNYYFYYSLSCYFPFVQLSIIVVFWSFLDKNNNNNHNHSTCNFPNNSTQFNIIIILLSFIYYFSIYIFFSIFFQSRTVIFHSHLNLTDFWMRQTPFPTRQMNPTNQKGRCVWRKVLVQSDI